MPLAGTYRPRQPENTAFYQCLEDYWDEFKEAYPLGCGLRNIFEQMVCLYRKQVANTLGEPAVTDGPLVIGSQLLEEKGSKGYYGLGKINRVKVTDGAMTEAQVGTFYDAITLLSG